MNKVLLIDEILLEYRRLDLIKESVCQIKYIN